MRSLTDKYWHSPETPVINDEHRALARTFKVAPEIIYLLSTRGVTTAGDIERFLYPKLEYLPPPSLLHGISAACELVWKAFEQGSELWIWGDYDVDGVTATALLVRFLGVLGVKVSYHIPHRLKEGYGLNKVKLQEIIRTSQKKVLFITVDCGISDHDAIAFIKKNDCDVIVTDHHQPGATLPPADVIINCQQQGDDFPEKSLAGVAHAFYLAVALRKFFMDQGILEPCACPNMKQFLDMVAIGTIADMVPLTSVNRILVRAGFEVLNRGGSLGIRALMRESDILSGDICSEDIAFQIGPKLNAAGRIEDGGLAVELLLAEDEKKAISLARKLTRINDERKEQCQHYLEITLRNIDREQVKQEGFLLHQLDCPLGIIGIIASQLVNDLFVPVILVSEADDTQYGKVLRGSCRSTEHVNMFQLLSTCKSVLLRFGGHPMAAGLTLEKEQFSNFHKAISSSIQNMERHVYQHAQTDCLISMDRAMEQDFIAGYKKLEPFGVNNEIPVFYNEKAILQNVKRIGKTGDHLKFTTRGKFGKTSCVSFGLGQLERQLFDQPTWDLVYSLTLNRFRHNSTWQANVLDIL